jgi:hypothetical protein
MSFLACSWSLIIAVTSSVREKEVRRGLEKFETKKSSKMFVSGVIGLKISYETVR